MNHIDFVIILEDLVTVEHHCIILRGVSILQIVNDCVLLMIVRTCVCVCVCVFVCLCMCAAIISISVLLMEHMTTYFPQMARGSDSK